MKIKMLMLGLLLPAAAWADEPVTVKPGEVIPDVKPLASERSAREEAFAEAVQDSTLRREMTVVAPDWLEAHTDSIMKLSGSFYLRPEITDTRYYLQPTDSTDSAMAVWLADYPAESIANLIVTPDTLYLDIPMELTIVLHDYGKQKTVKTTVDRFMAYCESEGCKPYWGLEQLNDDGTLQMALFLHNPEAGFDHVVKLNCSALDVIGSGAGVKARANLYIPMDNVDDIFIKMDEQKDKNKARWIVPKRK